MKNITLVKIGAIGGFLTVGMGTALKYKLSDNLKQTEFYKTALDLVRHNKAAVHYLGEPIKDKSIDPFDSKKNYMENGVGQFEVRLKGSKQNGTLHIYVQENTGDIPKGWKLSRLELALDKESDKRLLIKTESPQNNDIYSENIVF